MLKEYIAYILYKLYHVVVFLFLLIIKPLLMGRVKVPFNKKIEIKALLEYGVTQRRVAAAVGVSKKCVKEAQEQLTSFEYTWSRS